MINLYNFMDGIDGLAGGEAILVGLIAAAVSWNLGVLSLAAVALLTVSAAAGFLAWNWAPAKIFLGDAGSGFLGFVFAVMALASELAGRVPLILWLLLLGVFVFDATLTLARRVFHGDRWYEAHRLHAYQRAVEAGYSHQQVTITCLVLTGALGALAWIGTEQGTWEPAVLVAGIVLLCLAYLSVERIRPMYPASTLNSESLSGSVTAAEEPVLRGRRIR
jgi:Fuc2NAc and GlcNAc transferase